MLSTGMSARSASSTSLECFLPPRHVSWESRSALSSFKHGAAAIERVSEKKWIRATHATKKKNKQTLSPSASVNGEKNRSGRTMKGGASSASSAFTCGSFPWLHLVPQSADLTLNSAHSIWQHIKNALLFLLDIYIKRERASSKSLNTLLWKSKVYNGGWRGSCPWMRGLPDPCAQNIGSWRRCLSGLSKLCLILSFNRGDWWFKSVVQDRSGSRWHHQPLCRFTHANHVFMIYWRRPSVMLTHCLITS